MSNPELTFYTTSITVDQVGLFALKSGAETTVNGERPQAIDIGISGPMVHEVPDRGLVLASVVDADDRRAHFISLRGWRPGTELIRYAGDAELTKVRSDITDIGRVALSLPSGYGEHTVDFNDIAPDAPMWDVKIHNGSFPAVDLGDEAAKSFTALLADANKDSRRSDPVRNVRLFAPHPAASRLLRPEYRREGASQVLNAADGAQLTIANLATLAELERDAGVDAEESVRLGNRLRPRPNVWLGGTIASRAEDIIAALRIGDTDATELIALGASIRCVATGVHPITAERGKSFLGMLQPRRRVSKITGDTGVVFAGNFAPRPVNGTSTSIRTGDAVAVAWAATSNVSLPSERVKP